MSAVVQRLGRAPHLDYQSGVRVVELLGPSLAMGRTIARVAVPCWAYQLGRRVDWYPAGNVSISFKASGAGIVRAEVFSPDWPPRRPRRWVALHTQVVQKAGEVVFLIDKKQTLISVRDDAP